MLKKFTCIILSLLIAISSCLAFCDFSYADETIDQWEDVDSDELYGRAFNAYMKNRGGAYTSSQGIGKSLFNWDYNTLMLLGRGLGIDVQSLNNKIHYYVDNNGVYKFMYDTSAIGILNNLYEAVLDKYGIDYTNTDVDIDVYNGYATDNGFHLYVFDIPAGNTANVNLKQLMLTEGTFYMYSHDTIYNNWQELNPYFNLRDKDTPTSYNQYTATFDFSKYPNTNLATNKVGYGSFKNNSDYYDYSPALRTGGSINSLDFKGTFVSSYFGGCYGFPCIAMFKFNSNTYHLYFCNITYTNNNEIYIYKYGYLDTIVNALNNNAVDHDNIKFVAPKIKVPLPTDDPVIIDDDGNSDDDDDDDDNPSQKPVPPDSITPNPNNPSLPTGVPDVDFQMPNINIDWNLDLDIDNLPFPFSIPNDLYNAFNSLNVEPEAPHFQGNIDLVVYEWPVDIDFTDFSSMANVFRKWFLFLYIITLIIATRSVMHIY